MGRVAMIGFAVSILATSPSKLVNSTPVILLWFFCDSFNGDEQRSTDTTTPRHGLVMRAYISFL